MVIPRSDRNNDVTREVNEVATKKPPEAHHTTHRTSKTQVILAAVRTITM